MTSAIIPQPQIFAHEITIRPTEEVDEIPITRNKLGGAQDGSFGEGREKEPQNRGKDRARRIRRRPSRRRWLSRLITLFFLLPLGGVAGYLSVCLFLLPYFMQKILPVRLSETLHCPVTIGAASFDPFTLTLTLRDGKIQHPEGSDETGPLLSFATIKADFSRLSWPRGILITEQIEITRPFLSIIRKSDHTSSAQTLFQEIKETKLRLDTGASQPWDITGAIERLLMATVIHNLTIKDGSVVLSDLGMKAVHPTITTTIEEISLGFPFLGLGAGTRPEPSLLNPSLTPILAAKVDKSPFRIVGEKAVGSEEDQWRFQFHLENMNLATASAFFPLPGALPITKGNLALDLTILAGFQSETMFEFSGAAHLTDVMVEKDGTAVADLPYVTIAMQTGKGGRGLILEEMTLSKPRLFLERQVDGSWTASGIPLRDRIVATPREGERESLFANFFSPLVMNALTVKDGTVTVSDQFPGAPLHGTWTAFALSSAAGNETPGWNAFSVAGIGPSGEELRAEGSAVLAPFSLQGSCTILSATPRFFASFIGIPSCADAFTGGRIVKASAQFSSADATQGQLLLKELELEAEGLRFTAGDGEHLAISNLTLHNARIDAGARIVDLGVTKAEGSDLTILVKGGGMPTAWRAFFLPPASEGPVLEKPWLITSTSVSVSNSALRLTVSDEFRQWRRDFNNISLEIPEFNNDPTKKSTVKGSANVDDGAGDVEGALVFFPFSAELHITAKDLPLGMFGRSFDKWFAPETVSGKLALDGAIRLPDFAFQGDLGITDFSVTLNSGATPAMGWKNAFSHGVTFAPSALVFHGGEITLEAPFGDVEILGTSTIRAAGLQPSKPKTPGKAEGMFGPPAPGQPSENTPDDEEEETSYTFATLRLAGGRLRIKDHRFSPPFQAELENLRGELRDFANEPPSRTKLHLQGTEKKGASFTFDAVIGFFSDPPFRDHKTSITGYPLPDLRGYLRSIIGYEITAGAFDADIAYHEEEESIQAKATFNVRDFAYGAPVEKTGPLPLTVALLTDNHASMAIELPFKGVSVDPEFSVFGAIGEQLKKLLLKSTVSPHTVLAASAEGGLLADVTAPRYITFDPGSAELSRSGQESIKKLSGILAKRPLLRLGIKGYADTATDGNAIQGKKEEKKEKLASLAAERANAVAQALLAAQLKPLQVLVMKEPGMIADEERPGGKAELILTSE